MKKRVVLISFSLLMTVPAAMVAAEKASQPVAGDQRAACDAQCRENYQNNSAAMQACLRNCGAVGPANPAGAMAIGHEAPHTAQQATKVKGSKSNTSERLASPATPSPDPVESANLNLSKSNINRVAPPPPVPVETSNLNLSKSNIDRVAEPPAAGVPSVAATTVKSGKSNSSERLASPATPPVPLEGTTVKGSKSNSDNRLAQPSGDGAPAAEATTVKSSKSNSSDRQLAPDTGETPPVEPEDDVPSDG